MLEKIGIRIIVSLIVIWYIFQFNMYKLHVDLIVFLAMLLYSVLVTFIIESSLSLLRKIIKWTPLIIFVMIITTIVSYLVLGKGVYIYLIIYALCFISIDLYREYSMTNLLENAFKNKL
ncbi:MAG: hypothetical protein RR630_05130 [Coprobacillus sp.]